MKAKQIQGNKQLYIKFRARSDNGQVSEGVQDFRYLGPSDKVKKSRIRK